MMPFIGRLDEQVDDVLISPVSKRRRNEQSSVRDEEPTARRDPNASTQTPSEDESSAKPDELPIWLL